MRYRRLRAGPHGLLLEFSSLAEVHRMWRHLRSHPPEGVEEVVAGMQTVLLVLRSGVDGVSIPDPGPAVGAGGREIEIPVRYGGPDVDEVAALTGLTAAEVGAIHAAATYTVAFVGFSPGFAYLTGGDDRLDVPRRPRPRTSVAAGSVAIAAGLTAVYPQATPGGWRLIGHTSQPMFDPSLPEPSLLAPGDRVRFRAAESLSAAPANPPWPPASAPVASDLVVVDAGPQSTIQDRGRRGWGHVGVPRAGPADRASAAAANALVGNPPDAAVIEILFGGLRVRLGSARRLAATGADGPLVIDGLPARRGARLPVPAGAEVWVGSPERGLRTYLAVEGGVAVPPVLGSRSTDTFSGLGPPPLAAGDRLPLGPPSDVRGSVGSARHPQAGITPASAGGATIGGSVTVRATWGWRDAWLTAAGRRTLGESVFVVTSSSDRTGVRLDGPPVERRGSDELPSEGLVPGAVQVPPAGQPIVMMANHPTTGGYPVVAVVDDDGIDRLAQCPAGTRVRFHLRQTSAIA